MKYLKKYLQKKLLRKNGSKVIESGKRIMKINKIIKSKIEREFFFLRGNLSIDNKYFIKKIEEGIKKEGNENYATYVKSPMTNYKYFIGDKMFLKNLLPVFDLLDQTSFYNAPKWQMHEAWGFKQGFADYSKRHHHNPAFLSGVIILNNHPQTLYFSDIKEKLEAKPGNFAIFSSFLEHSNSRNVTDKVRYGLSFNLYYV